jgi:hypothetical protein
LNVLILKKSQLKKDYIYPLNKKDVVTKISIATEEIYKIEKEKFNHANKM